MSLISRLSHLRAAAAALAFAPLVTAVSPAGAEPRDAWPAQVRALYRIDFNSFDIGTFEFDVGISGRHYTAKGNAQLSALLGAFKWRGLTQSTGTLAGDAPKPADYLFDYAGSSRSGVIKMGFAGNGVTSLTHTPTPPAHSDEIPVREAHLKSVLDPLSAVMALSRSTTENPCNRRLAVFDGKQRFDLVLTFNRQETITEARPSGQPGIAFVCRVRYEPIAGHRPSDETKALAMSAGIEVSLRPVPSAKMFIPHQITIPTGVGPATLTSLRVDIVTPRNEQIALTQ